MSTENLNFDRPERVDPEHTLRITLRLPDAVTLRDLGRQKKGRARALHVNSVSVDGVGVVRRLLGRR